MGWFIASMLLLLAGIGLAVGGGMFADKDYKGGFVFGGAVAVVLAIIVFLIGGFKEVPVKSVGVVTSFGQVEGFTGPGPHLMWPWKNVSVLPETIQTTTFEGDGNNGTCLDVRIGGQQQACLDVTIQWQIKDSAADSLFRNYDTSGSSVLDDITNAVVVRELKVAVNEVMGDYNPIEDVSVNGTAGNSQFSTFGPLVLAAMQRDIGSQIDIHSVLIPFLHYDSATQDRLDAIQQQFGATAIAQQEIKTNQALALANAAIAKTSLTSGVLEAECLGIVQDAEKTGYQLPVGFNCLGSSPSLALSK
jgi:regulator of protease activity HflC (stomatin/prohibitin superfamily)